VFASGWPLVLSCVRSEQVNSSGNAFDLFQIQISGGIPATLTEIFLWVEVVVVQSLKGQYPEIQSYPKVTLNCYFVYLSTFCNVVFCVANVHSKIY
jgi:hypothetical protein